MKNEKLNKVVLPILAGLLSVVGIILVAMFLNMPDAESLTPTDKEMYDGRIANSLVFTIAIIGAAIAAILLFFLVQLVTNFKKVGKLLIGFVLFLIVAAVCYFMAGGEVTEPMLKATEGDPVDSGTVKWIEAGLYLTFALAGIAGLLWVVWGSIARKL